MDMMMNMEPIRLSPLSPDGVDFSNSTQAGDFLDDLLDDDILKLISKNFATRFWFGIAALCLVVAALNALSWFGRELR